MTQGQEEATTTRVQEKNRGERSLYLWGAEWVGGGPDAPWVLKIFGPELPVSGHVEIDGAHGSSLVAFSRSDFSAELLVALAADHAQVMQRVFTAVAVWCDVVWFW